MSIQTRYLRVVEEVEQVCREAGRNPRDVRIVAVSKTVDEDGVAQAIEAGAHSFGENRPDVMLPKVAAFPESEWHFIGNIQSRRIRDIVEAASLIHSLYQPQHIARIDAAAASLGKVQDVLIEVNVSGEESKSGLKPSEVKGFLEQCLSFEHMRVRGLMTMAPRGSSEQIHASFQGLAKLMEELKEGLDAAQAHVFNELSMGMSEDWREAIAQGATIVRIGRAIFSDDFD